jgi:hypothetical protein
MHDPGSVFADPAAAVAGGVAPRCGDRERSVDEFTRTYQVELTDPERAAALAHLREPGRGARP